MPDSLVIPYSKALGRSSKVWTPTEMALADFFKMLDKPMPGEKGSVGCFTPARFKENIRSKLTATEIHMIVLDLDIHCQKKRILDRIKSLGVLVHLSSTASHGLTFTEVGVIEFDTYRAQRLMEGFAGTEETLVAEWLTKCKGHHSSLIPVTGVRVQPITKRTTEEKADGTTRIVVEHKLKIFHNPIHKFRILIPLAVPWRAADYASPTEAADAWAELYLRTIDTVDLPCDEVCRTPDRLIYFTAIPDEDADRRTLACHCTIQGPLFEPRTLPTARIRPPAPPKLRHGAMGTELRVEGGRRCFDVTHAEWVDPVTNRPIDVLEWYRTIGRRFRISDALRARGVAVSDNRDDGYDGQVHWLCPYEGEHSPTNGGFFTKNARTNEELGERAYGSEKGWTEFVCTCGHHTCDGRHKLDFILKFLDLGMLTIDDLYNEEFLVTAGLYDEFGEIIAEDARGTETGDDDLAALDAQAGEMAAKSAKPKQQRTLAELFLTGTDDLRKALESRRSDPDKKAKIDKAWEGLRGEGSVAWLDAAAETEGENGHDWLCSCAAKLIHEDPARIANPGIAGALYALSESKHSETYQRLKNALTSKDFGKPVVTGTEWDKQIKKAAKAVKSASNKVTTESRDVDTTKPTVLCFGGRIGEAAAKFDDIIAAMDPPIVFYRNGLVKVVSDPITTIVDDVIKLAVGSYTVDPLLDPDACGIISNHVQCIKEGVKGAITYIDPPSNYVSTWRTMGNSKVPTLRALTQIPIIRRDGSIMTEPGYDRETFIYHCGNVIVDVPETPTKEDVESSLSKLLTPFSGFPFVSKSSPRNDDIDRAVLLAAIFSLALRPQISISPIIAVSARSSRTGKGLLVSSICTLVTGANATTVAPVNSKDPEVVSEEHRKRITTFLKKAPAAVHFDNETGAFGSDPLCTLLTTPIWEDRKLSTNDMVRVPNTSQLFVSGNNIGMLADMVGRSLIINMDAEEERPESRTFDIPDLESFIKQNRTILLSALFTILRAYRQAGRPGAGTGRLGAFEQWSDDVGACVRWLGFPNPKDCQNQLIEIDESRSKLEILLSNWFRMIADKPVTARELTQYLERGAMDDSEPAALVKDALGPFRVKSPIVVGRYLNTLKGAISGGYRLSIEKDQAANTMKYAVTQFKK